VHYNKPKKAGARSRAKIHYTVVLLHLVDLLSENCSVGSEINPLELANNASQTCSPSAKCSKVLEGGGGGGGG
jgi:hypothetical protein